jgi:cation diffusion facilitator family transporter
MRQATLREFLRTGEGVTLGGSVLNLALVLVKLAAGVLGNSAALVADAVHSLSDLASDIVVLFGYRVGRTPEDDRHPYGHGKVETLCTAVVGGLLVAVAVGLAVGAGGALWRGGATEAPGWVALWAALASIVVKEWLYRWTAAAARETDSQLLLANAWHHRSDALSSIAAVVGVFGARWGALWMDPAAALVVCGFVGKVGWELGWQAVHDLVDTSVDGDRLAEIDATIDGVAGVRSHHGLKTRRLGKDILVDVDVEVDPDLNVVQGHDVARAVRNALLRRVKSVRDAMVHVEPVGARDGGDLTPAHRTRLAEAAETAARGEPGVLGVHGTRIIPLGTGYLLNLDVEVSPELTIRDAHDIAHNIKRRVRAIRGVADAVIHVDVHGE